MTYPVIGEDKFIEKLLDHKEFNELKLSNVEHESTSIDQQIKKSDVLRLRPHQQFVRRYMNMYGPGHRMLVKHKTGTGKSILSLGLAKEFLNVFRTMHTMGERTTGSVIIIGFNIKPIFYRELLRFPEFGFITYNELEHYNKLMKRAESENLAEINVLKDFRANIIRRLYKKTFGGHFKFFGYKEFVNRLFTTNISTESEEINLKSLNNEQIRDLVKQGRLLINIEIVKLFENSILICDEIHNVYNSLERNNYGVAIQTIVNEVKSLKTIYLSATPLNNSPTEYIDLQNLLLDASEYIKKEDFFTDGKIKPEKLKVIHKLLSGKVSFFQNDDPKYFPRVLYSGELLKLDSEGKKLINSTYLPYLKFERHEMSDAHKKAYHEHYEGTLSIDNRTLDDMVFPGPQGGLFNTSEIKKHLKGATKEWLSKNKVEIREENGQFIIGGDFLLKENVGKWGSKLLGLLNKIQTILTNKNMNGKIIIYHPFVSMSGILLLRELLKKNHIPDLYGEADDLTPCSICGVVRELHDKHMNDRTKVKDDELHGYIPTRFIAAYGGIDRSVLNRHRNRFNSPDNLIGQNIKILIGSRVIKEGFDFSAVRHLFVMYKPINMSELIQVIGRGVRHASHSQLSPSHQNVTIYLMVSSMKGKTTHEEMTYVKKMSDHLEIQKIEKIMNSSAVDANIYKRPTIDEDSLVSVKYEVPHIKKYNIKELELSTFYAFYANEEVRTIKYIIKRLFVEINTVWNYSELWKQCKNPPFEIFYNSELFLESSFVIALSELVWDYNNAYVNQSQESIGFVDQLFSDNKEITTLSGQTNVIVQIKSMYIMVPMNNNIPSIDVESCFRDYKTIKGKNISLKKYISESDHLYDYTQNKIRFHARYDGAPLNRLPLSLCEYNSVFYIHFIEDVIQYVFNIWTNPDAVINEYHDFNFRMLYFYSSLELVIYSNTVEDIKSVQSVYDKYVSYPTATSVQGKPNISKKAILALLQTSVDRHISVDGCVDAPQLDEQKIVNLITESREHVENHNKSKLNTNISVVDSSILPVGHLLGDVARVFLPETGWTDLPEYTHRIKTSEYVENDIIIGYYEKSGTGLKVNFKIRSPVQQIKKHKDTRLIERGSVCASKKKQELLVISKKLGIRQACVGIKSICTLIKIKLIENEIRERRKGTNVKWFYHLIEEQPI